MPTTAQLMLLAKARRRRAESGAAPNETSTPDARISEAFSAAADQPPARLSADPSWGVPKPNEYGFGQRVADALPFGKDVAAVGAAAGQQLAELTGRTPAETTFGQDYTRAKALRDRYREEYDAAHPIASTAAEVAGLATAGPARGGEKTILSLAEAAPTFGGRVVQSGKAGAAIGALQGASEGDGLTERVKNAAIGTGIGAATGIVAPVLVEGGAGIVKRALSPVTNAVGNRLTPGNRAAGIVNEALTRDAVPVSEAASRLRAQQPVNPNVVLADVAGANTRGLARAAVNTPGAARERITDFVTERNLRQPERIVNAVSSVLRNPADFGRTVARMAAERENVASPIYNQAFAKAPAVDASGVVRYIDGLVRPGVNQIVNPLADLRPDGITATLGKLRSFFATQKNQRVGLEALHRVKMEIDDVISTAMRAGDTNKARAVLGVQNRLLKAMDSASPDYQRARQIYSSTHGMDRALETGRNVFSMSSDDVTTALQGMTTGEREMVQVGLARAIQDQVENRGRGSDVLRTVFKNERIMKSIRAAFQNDQAFRKFQATLIREAAMRRTADAVTGNSTTARQIADLIDTQGGAVGRDVFSQLIEGRPIRAVATAIRQVIFGEKGINERVADRIADMLLSNDPQKMTNALKTLGRKQGAVQRLVKRLSAIGRGVGTAGAIEGTRALPASQQ